MNTNNENNNNSTSNDNLNNNNLDSNNNNLDNNNHVYTNINTPVINTPDLGDGVIPKAVINTPVINNTVVDANFKNEQNDQTQNVNTNEQQNGSFGQMPSNNQPMHSTGTPMPNMPKAKKNKKQKNKGSKGTSKATIAGVLVVGMAVGSVFSLSVMRESIVNEAVVEATNKTSTSAQAQTTAVNASSDTSIQNSSAQFNNTSSVIDKVRPSVVSIGILSSYDSENLAGAGTGVAFETDAEKVYIATNNHVISGASGVRVWFDGSEDPVSAKLVGTDLDHDLAVISVSLADLKAIGIDDVKTSEFGNSDDIKVGDSVIAIGNAMGEGISSTGGMVSMKDKVITENDGSELTVIQTDASINPGNSGGPLVDYNGDIIGINTAKLVQTFNTSVEGVGYAVPSNDVVAAIDDIMQRSEKAYLGIKGATIDSETAKMFSLPEMGVYVSDVIEGGSAELAGIQSGDIITSYNNKTVTDISTLQELIKDTKISSTVPITIYREGESITIKAKMQQHEDSSFE